MANSSDSSGKPPIKPLTDTAPKKPAALIDLKATEVDIRDARQDQKAAPANAPAPSASTSGTSASSATSAAAASISAAAAMASPATPTPTTLGTTAPGKPPSGTTNTTSSAAAAAPGTTGRTTASQPPATPLGSPPKTTAPPLKPPVAGGGLRGAATHLVAGLAGGLLALIGADTLAPKLGLKSVGSSEPSTEIVMRLRKLEASAARPAPTDVDQKLAAAETRLGDLERTSRVVSELSQQQTKLADDTRILGERLSQAPPETTADGRLAKLEDTLSVLSAAALADTQKGRIPQLAAITGRLTDLESSLATQMATLRKGVTQEVDSRLGQSSEAAQAARAGTQRLDRELSGVKTESAQLSQRLESLAAQTDRAEAVLRGLREETATLKGDLGATREDLRQVSRPTDVASALTPLTSKLSLLEQNVQGVVRNEDDRRANVERIVTALELGNLKRTVERGASFTAELAEVRRVAGPKLDLTVLERYRDKGVPSLAELERDFRKLSFAIIDADARPAAAHWTDRLLASAKSVVRVRKTDQAEDAQGVDAIVARMETGLKSGRLMDVAAEAAKLSKEAKAPALPWLEKVDARLAVDRAIGAIEQELKSSLGAASQAGKKG